MPKRVTMKEVAVAAGVSASTVCRALGMDPQIPETTRKRIKKAAASLGYLPDPLLSAFAQRRRGKTAGSEITTLAYITNFETADDWMRHHFYEPVFKGAKAQALRNGYKLEHFWMREPGMSGERLSRILHNRGIVGICIAPTPNDRGRLDLDWNRFSCVTIGYSLLQPVLHRATPHHFHAILTAVRKLWKQGYTRIGFCLFAGTSPRVDDLWLAGALLTRQHNPDAGVKIFLFDDDTRSKIPDWAIAEKLEVIVSDNLQALHELQRRGIRAPGDIDYATVNWSKAEPEIAGVNQRPDSIGAAAIDIAIAQLRRAERGIPEIPVTSMVEGIWVDGPSLPRKARTS
jgi:LacI family transcriptional regulator